MNGPSEGESLPERTKTSMHGVPSASQRKASLQHLILVSLFKTTALVLPGKASATAADCRYTRKGRFSAWLIKATSEKLLSRQDSVDVMMPMLLS